MPFALFGRMSQQNPYRHSSQEPFDVAIVGGGPAGLAAAMSLGRYLRSVVVFDSGDARARLIPRTHNCPGFPQGIAGVDLLRRLRIHAETYGAKIIGAGVDAISQSAECFVLTTTFGMAEARFVILASGIVDKAPAIAGLQDAIASGTVRLCPVCDAYEARDRRIGIVGPEKLAIKEALYLRDYSRHVAVLFNHPEEASTIVRQQACAAGIEILDVVDDLVPRKDGLEVVMADGSPPRQLDLIYVAMGCDVRSELAAMLGAERDRSDYVLVGDHLETSVPRLYAIGDVAKALNQISVGFGHAALAAVDIHNKLRESATTPRERVTA